MAAIDDDPIELNIGLEKIRDIVLKAREFDLEEFPDEPETGGESDPVSDRESLLDEGLAKLREEFEPPEGGEA